MKKIDITKKLRSFCTPYLVGKSFKFDSKFHTFHIKNSESLKFVIGFHLLKTYDSQKNMMGFKFEPHLSLYNYEIDEIFKKVSKRYKQLSIEDNPLFSVRIGDLKANTGLEKKSRNNFNYIPIFDLNDFEKNKSDWDSIFYTYAFPFFERYTPFEEQYKALQFDPSKIHLLNMWPAERILKSIILAKIMGTHNVSQLFDKYEELFIKKFDSESQGEFNELRAILL